MPRLRTARLANQDQDLVAPRPYSLPELPADVVVATVSARSAALTGADWVRIDGSLPPLEAAALRTQHAPVAAMLDLPGPGSPRARSPLTTTESLVFAASEDFAWVNLRDLEGPAELERARFILGGTTRLSCTVGSARVLQRDIDTLCSLGDALILDLRALESSMASPGLELLLHAVVQRAHEQGTPVLLIPGLAPAQTRESRTAAASLGSVVPLLGAGARGLVLTRETEWNAEAQSAIDLARDLINRAREAAGRPKDRASARLVSEALEDPSGWVRPIR